MKYGGPGMPDFNLSNKEKCTKMATKNTKWLKYIPKWHKNTKWSLHKCIKMFRPKAIKNIPKLVFFGKKNTIWQPCGGRYFPRLFFAAGLVRGPDRVSRKTSTTPITVTQTLSADAGLPDGVFSYQKIQIWVHL
jgi:hypothetical protein